MSSDDDSTSSKSMTSATKSIKSVKSKFTNRTIIVLKGKIEELGNNVHTCGNSNSGDYYNKVTENIGDYAAREYSKHMRNLIVDGIEDKPIAPKRPEVKKGETVNPFVMKDKGQCSDAMVTKLESNKDYKTIMKEDDVIKLMKLIKSLCHENNETKYEYWNVSGTMIRLYKMRQKNDEKLVSYYKRFNNMVELAEVQGGLIVPEVLAKKEDNYQSNKDAASQKCRNKYLACVFLRGVNWNKHGSCIKELNNMYLSGHNNYPKSVADAVNHLSNYMDTNKKSDGNKEWKESSNEESRSFAQSTKALRCFNCGEPGYTKLTCPKCNKDKNLLNVTELPTWMMEE